MMQHMPEIIDIDLNMETLNQTLENPQCSLIWGASNPDHFRKLSTLRLKVSPLMISQSACFAFCRINETCAHSGKVHMKAESENAPN